MKIFMHNQNKMLTKLKYYFLYWLFYINLTIIKKCIETLMRFEIDSTPDNAQIQDYVISDDLLNDLVNLYIDLE